MSNQINCGSFPRSLHESAVTVSALWKQLKLTAPIIADRNQWLTVTAVVS
jgi:hypothetical protein